MPSMKSDLPLRTHHGQVLPIHGPLDNGGFRVGISTLESPLAVILASSSPWAEKTTTDDSLKSSIFSLSTDLRMERFSSSGACVE